MKRFHKSLGVAALCGGFALAGAAGLDLIQGRQSAGAARSVAVAPQDLAAVHDMSAVFRNVDKTVEASVVNIRVVKTVPNPAAQFDNPMLRKFFKEHGNDLPLPPEFFGPGGQGSQGDQGLREIGTGSGVIMDASHDVGYILTNNHVAGDAGQMEVTLADGRVFKDAKLVGADPKTDLAVVEIKADNLTPAEWGDSGELRKGDWILAFGSPFGYVGSMTHGIVSALDRQAGILGSTGYEDFIQVDAPINPGNSGGPLVNMNGQVVGINTAIASRSGGFQGIGFAIPSDQARPIYEILKEHGKIVRGWLGAQIESVAQAPDQARSEGFKRDTGVLIEGVLKGAPASGILHPGDIVVSLDGKAVHNSNDLRNQVALDAPGTKVEMNVFRDGKMQDVSVKLGEQPANPEVASVNEGESEAPTQAMGMQLTDPTSELAQKYGLGTVTGGALVTAVEPNSAAAQAGIQPGDLITRVNNQDVATAAEAHKALSHADLKKGIRLYIINRQGSNFLFLQSDNAG